jgi:hypothetical protein
MNIYIAAITIVIGAALIAGIAVLAGWYPDHREDERN